MGSNEENQPPEDKIYHERQVKALCALHALNNLFQKEQTFTKKDLDEICERLSPGTLINPHRSMLGLGNYDVNVLMAALQDKGYETIWFDKRKNVKILVPENIMGFILNTPSAFHFGPLRLALHCKHWIALRRLKGQYMNLDSKLPTPAVIGNEDQLVEFLHDELHDGKKELLLVVETDIYDSNAWRMCDSDEEEDLEDEGHKTLEGEGGSKSNSVHSASTSEQGSRPHSSGWDTNINSGNCADEERDKVTQENSRNCDDSEKSQTSGSEDIPCRTLETSNSPCLES